MAEAWSESCVLAATVPDVVGYLHNRLRSHPGGDRRQRCGTERRPWIISVLPGQRINVTLLDFTAFHGRRLPQTNRKVCRRHWRIPVQNNRHMLEFLFHLLKTLCRYLTFLHIFIYYEIVLEVQTSRNRPSTIRRIIGECRRQTVHQHLQKPCSRPPQSSPNNISGITTLWSQAKKAFYATSHANWSPYRLLTLSLG